MADLRAMLEALEQRLERTEAVLRDGPPWALRLPTVPVTFEDIVVHFSGAEWASLDDGQKELYRTVMEDNYEMLVSLYCAMSKPEFLFRIERGEELHMPVATAGLEGTDMSLERAAEPDSLSCTSDRAVLEMKRTEYCEGICGNPEESRTPVVSEKCSALHVPHEATAVPADLSQPTLSPSCPVSTCLLEAGNLNESPSPPPAAADAEMEIPTEVPQEDVAGGGTTEEPAVPETPSKSLEEEDMKDVECSGQSLEAELPANPEKEATLDDCGVMVPADPSCTATTVGEPMEASCVGQRNSTREKTYSCSVCRKNFLLEINLILHQCSHSNWLPYICVHCGRSFMSKRKIRHHLRAREVLGLCQPSDVECSVSQHQGCSTARGKPSTSRFPLSPGNVMYTCKECMESFSSQSFLILHQWQHSQHHLILCPCCNQSFTWASEFVRYHQPHIGERPYQCGVCQKAFKRYQHLSMHQRIHERQNRPYPCTEPPPVPAAPV
ncbi:zinc finger protein 398-like [Strigops habroptila]|uniref:zinc finger protein 398-like n=1 Tax=Strigops habroptila TaxID=2489341 RepID=UPI0011CEF10D|nr:zinc finger protein 398-like [Strigops habroptila]